MALFGSNLSKVLAVWLWLSHVIYTQDTPLNINVGTDGSADAATESFWINHARGHKSGLKSMV